MARLLYSALLSTLILFVWGGVAQLFPWGVPSTQVVVSQQPKITDEKPMESWIYLPPNELTTAQFDAQFSGKISTLTTDETFSWIVSTPYKDDYLPRHFMLEVFTQFLVGLFLALLLQVTSANPLGMRVLVVSLAGVTACIAIYGQLMNWWSVPALYAVGASINLILGWSLAGYMSARFILKRDIKLDA